MKTAFAQKEAVIEEQNQQQPTISLSQESLQQLIALAVRVVAQLDDRILNQLRENNEFSEEIAQAIVLQMQQITQSVIAQEPEWTVEERRIEDLVHEEELDRMHENGLSFGRSYSSVHRNGEQVLYLLSEHYDESVLEAAKEDDLQPPKERAFNVSTLINVGNQHVAMVEGGASITPKTLEVIQGNIERQKDPDLLSPSLTASSQPRISWPTYLRGVGKARL